MEPPIWLIGFAGFEETEWWNRFTRKGYHHVFAMGYEPKKKVWLLAEWSSIGAMVRVLDDAAAHDLIKYCYDTGGSVYQMPRNAGMKIKFLRPGYCVGFIKHLLGLRLPFVITPWQLACAVRKMGNPAILADTFTE